MLIKDNSLLITHLVIVKKSNKKFNKYSNQILAKM